MPEPVPQNEAKDLFERYRSLMAAREKAEGRSPSLIVCTDAGCWQPQRETWQEFCTRKGLDPETELVL